MMKSPHATRQARTSATHLNIRLIEGDTLPEKLAYLVDKWGISQSNVIRQAITLCYNAEVIKAAKAEGGG